MTTTTGTRTLSNGAKLVIWEREDGYYWLIDGEAGERIEEMGPFETIHEAEEDAQAWFAARHADEDPFLGGENPLEE